MNPLIGNLSGMYNGVPVFVSPYATQQVHKVVKSVIRKRRRNYRVEKQHNPAAYMMLGRLVVHPAVWEQMQRKQS